MWDYILASLSQNRAGILYFSVVITMQMIGCITPELKMQRLKGSLKIYLAYWIIKSIFFDLVWGYILQGYISQNEEMRVVYGTLKAVFALVSTYMVWETYEGGLIRTIFFSMMAEFYAMSVGGISRFAAGENALRFALVYLLIHLILMRLLHVRLIKLRDYRIRYPKVWAAVFLAFMGAAWSEVLVDQGSNLSYVYRMNVLFVLLSAAAVVILSVRMFQEYRRQIMRENDALKNRSKLLALYMGAVYRQIRTLEAEKRKTDAGMEEILRLEGSGISSEKIRSYLATLRKEYHAVTAGVYSQDLMAGAVIHYYSGICRERGIQSCLSLAGYQGRSLKGEREGGILMCLLETGVEITRILPEGKRWIRLDAGTVKRRAVFCMECSCEGKKRRSLKFLRRYMKQEGCGVTIRWEKDCLHIEVVAEYYI